MARTADYIKTAEGIRSNEISSRNRIESLNNEISSVNSQIGGYRNEIASLEAMISAEMSRPTETDENGNTYGGPDYSAIASYQADISAAESAISSLESRRSSLEGERDTEQHHLQEILVEKAATLGVIQSMASDAAASVAAAGGMVGAYSGIGANLAGSFQQAHSNLATAAGILGGFVGGVSAGGGGGGGSGRSASGIRGVPSQTRNLAAGMTTNGRGGGARTRSGSAKSSASGACRGMNTAGNPGRGGTTGVFRTAQTSAAGTAFGMASTAGASGTGNTPVSISKYSTSKSPSSTSSFKPVITRHLPSSSRGSWDGKEGNSTYSLYDDMVYRSDNHGTTMTGRDIRRKFGASSVRYTGGEPDFYPFVDSFLGGIHLDQEIPYQRNGNRFERGTFDIANEIAAMRWAMDKDGLTETEARSRLGEYVKKVKQYMKDKGLTWHECGDLHSILPIPSAINKIFPHTGGISIKLEKQAAANILRERIGGRKLKPVKGAKYHSVDSEQVQNAINGYKNDLKQEKQRIKDFKVRKADLFGYSESDDSYQEDNKGLKTYTTRSNRGLDDSAPLIKGLDKTKHGYQTTYVNGREAMMYDDPDNRAIHKILYNQGKVWDNGPKQTCGPCSCATVINMLGLNVDEERVVSYAIRHGLCRPQGFTTPDEWVKILRGVGGIEAKAERKVPLKNLAEEVEKGKGVIIGVSACKYCPDLYGKYPFWKMDGHAITITSVIRDKQTNEILQYVVVDSNPMSPDEAVRRVDAKVLNKAYKKFRKVAVVTDQILR